MKDGRVVHAEDCRREGDEIWCRRAGGRVGFPAEQVDRIERGGGAHPFMPGETGSQPPAARPEVEGDRGRLEALTAMLHRKGVDDRPVRDEIALLHARLGNTALAERRLEEAEEHYRASLGHRPDLTVVSLNLSTTLIEMNRHDEATTILQGILSTDPLSARALFLLGEVAFQTGRMDEAIELWERSLEIEPRDTVRARLEKARRLQGAEEGFYESRAAHFTLRFDGDDASPALAQEILDALEDIYGDLSLRLLHYPDATVRVTLYPSSAFHEATETPAWVGGLFDGQIRVPVGGVGHLTPALRRVLAHELAHCFVASKTRGNAPQWLHEGLAQVVEGRTARTDRRALAQAYRMLGGASAATAFSYPRSLSQVEFLLEHWSWSHLNDLLDQLGRGTDISPALRETTGLAYAEFLAAWGEWLQG